MLNAPKQKRSEHTLQRMLTVCERLIDEGAFEQATMQDIAREAGVAVGTLYKRFPSKAAILDFLIERLQTRQYENLHAELMAFDEVDLSARVAHLSRVLCASADRHQGLLRTVITAHLLGKSPLSTESAGRSTGLVEAMAVWLTDSKPSPSLEACRGAVAVLAFSLQFRAVYPTPDAVLGASGYAEVVEAMALQYLNKET